MSDTLFELYRTRVLKIILEIDRKANLALFGDTLIRHYLDAGYSEKSAATAIIEVVSG